MNSLEFKYVYSTNTLVPKLNPLKKLNQIWQNLSTLGVDDGEETDKRAVILLNKILLISSTLILLFIPVEFASNDSVLVPFELLSVVLLGGILLLNKCKLHVVAKYSTIILGMLMIAGSTLAVGGHSNSEFNLFAVILLPLLFFRKKINIFLVSGLVVLGFFAVKYTYHHITPIVHVPLDVRENVQYIMNFVTILFLFAEFYYFKNMNMEYEGKLEKQHKEIEKSHAHITSSINYAKRIQDALLKHEEEQYAQLLPHFILFKPKDIVSGDFYWMLEKQGHLYMAAADCTGHGVPGAFLTMLGTSFLNEINSSEQLLKPADILGTLRDRIVKELSQTGATGDSKDGMDISLIRLNLTDLSIEWAGANNPLYILRKGEPEIEIIKGDAQPIGYSKKPVPFVNHALPLEKGDTFYLFSDGLPDQFGGPNNKKFGYKRLRKLLIENCSLSMEEQEVLITNTFDTWLDEGRDKQIDDVCVIGVRV